MGDSSRGHPSVLIVTAFFAPSRRVGARRPERMASQLVDRGWSVSVLTLETRYVEPLDPSMETQAKIEVIRTGMPSPVDWLRRFRSSIRRSTRVHSVESREVLEDPERGPTRSGGFASRLRDALEFPDPYAGWRWSAPWSVLGRSYDVVVATIPPYSSALVGRAIAKRCGAKYVLDYRDPWAESPGVVNAPSVPERLRRRHRDAEDACLADADLVFSVSRTLCERLARRSGHAVQFLPNAVDATAPTAFLEARDEGEFVYAGSLSYGRDLSALMRALAEVADAGPARPRLAYAGPHSDLVRAQAERVGATGRLNVLGNVSHADALAILRGARVGVVVVSDAYDYAIPGKIFDILGVRKPILILGPPHFEACRMVSRYHLGWTCDPGEKDRLREVVRAVMLGSPPAPLALDDYGTEATGAHLDRELRGLIPPR